MERTGRQRGNDMGATGRAVASNLKRIRQDAGLTQSQLAARVGALGHFMPTAALGKIETADRRCDVDDLVVLSVALNVSPLALLIPQAPRPTDLIGTSGLTSPDRAIDVWSWAVGKTPLVMSEQMEDAVSDIASFRVGSLPPWLDVELRPGWGSAHGLVSEGD